MVDCLLEVDCWLGIIRLNSSNLSRVNGAVVGFGTAEVEDLAADQTRCDRGHAVCAHLPPYRLN
jgi:hypothetical protein